MKTEKKKGLVVGKKRKDEPPMPVLERITDLDPPKAKKKKRIISTGANRANSDRLYCICKQHYDETRYVSYPCSLKLFRIRKMTHSKLLPAAGWFWG